MSSAVNIETTPSGAEIRWKNYSTPEAEWHSAGRSPLNRVRIPLGMLRVEVSKDGFETLEAVLVKYPDLHDAKVEPEMGVCGEQIRLGRLRVADEYFQVELIAFRS